MIFNNPKVAKDVEEAMNSQILRLRLSWLQIIVTKLSVSKPKNYGRGKWLADMNQVERLIHQTQEFIESREAQDV